MVHEIFQRWRELGVTVRVAALASTLLLVAAVAAVVATMAAAQQLQDWVAPVTADSESSPPGHRGAKQDAPPGAESTGVRLTATVNELGGVEVVERLKLSWPVTRLTVSPPPPPPPVSGAPAPRLVDLEVTANGIPVTLPWRGAIDGDRELVLPRPTSRFELRYQVRGAAVHSPTAEPGRVTVSLRPATVAAMPDDAPAVVKLVETRVHTLMCVQQPLSRQLCGIERSGGWRTLPIAGDYSQVLALVDLPDSGG